MIQAKAIIINDNPMGRAVAASAARMSTQSGTAMQIYAKSGNEEKDLNLLRKVLSSGHRSVIEHQTFGIALNDVSVLAEQFFIEFRLASFTVKSRRYVDFSEAGYLIPEGLTGDQIALYKTTMETRFADYNRLLELGIPKEDARFVFPYCLRSNFFMTVNARELMYMIRSLIAGRGARFAELRSIGHQLKEQFEALYPDVLNVSESAESADTQPVVISETNGTDADGDAELIGTPSDASALLDLASHGASIEELIRDERPRALEMLNYTFRIRNCSLACLTHFTRHRMQSPLIEDIVTVLKKCSYVLPDTVAANTEAAKIYHAAFTDQQNAAIKAASLGLGIETLSYFCLSGHELDFLMTMNARELMHFFKLRTCRRAQWEIQGIARKMLKELTNSYPELFSHFGPTCLVTGKCPEGKMTCGHPVKVEELQA